MTFSKKERQRFIKEIQETKLDLLIIGGGITGAGVAIQAAATGMRTGLIEMQDFAEGTSSRSTKLVHGGIRYLKNFDVEVVADTVSERAIVQQIAPHIPKPDPMLLPIYEDEGKTTFNMFSVKVAMDLYDQLANVTGSKYENYTLTKEEVLERAPLLKEHGLLGAGVYLDFRNNDSRLVIENIKQAVADGGLMISKMKAIAFLYEEGKICGVRARDLLTDEVIEIHATVVINTSGPWVDKVRGLNFTRAVGQKMRPTKGIHLVIDGKKLPVPQPIYFDTGKHDGRMVFAIPREDKTYFGTTDTDYQGDLVHPTVTQADVDYLLEVINYRFPEAGIVLADIESSWVGLRPLLSDNSGSDYNGGDNGSISEKSFKAVIEAVSDYKEGKIDRSRVESILNHLESSHAEQQLAPSSVSRGSSLEQEEDGLITLSGGKITDYRKMAAGALELILNILEASGSTFVRIDSKTYQVSGGHFDPTKVEELVEEGTKKGVSVGLNEEEARYIVDFYGSNAEEIFKYISSRDAFEGLSLAESGCLYYGLEAECVLTPTDYLLRRTNHILFQRDSLDEVKQSIVQAMSNYFGWTMEEQSKQEKELNEAIATSDLLDLKEGRE